MSEPETSAGDDGFLDEVADRLAALPGVQAVTLGGSRATGTHSAGSDWDLAIYYRGDFDPQTLRDLGWPGEVSEIGGWGGGVFNGGAWLTIDGKAVDVHYRDLAVVDHERAEADAGRFHIEPLMFHLAGIPSYLVVGELALNRVLRGELPRPLYPNALRDSAPRVWAERAALTLAYADAHASRGSVTLVAGTIAVAATQQAHAALASRGDWPTNEKRLLVSAGLDGVDRIVGSLGSTPESLTASVAAVRELFAQADATSRRQD